MDQPLHPSTRPRRGVLAAIGAGITATLVGGAIVLGGSSAVEASGLSTFSSCAELREWGEESMARQWGGTENFEMIGQAIEGDAATAADSGAASSSGSGATGTAGAPASTTAPVVASEPEDGTDATALPRTGDRDDGDATNVIVEGIDEPDLVERLGGDRALVVGGQTLAVVDLATAQMEASTQVPWGAQVTYDADAGIAWAVGSGDQGEVVVQRFAVGDDALLEDGSWSTAGHLVSVRRQGGELLVVATDGFQHTFETRGEAIGPGVDASSSPGSDGAPDGPGSAPPAEDDVPFAGGPVPCDQVLHPQGPAEPTATLVVVLPVTGELAPTRSVQVVGSGANVHVTADAAYLATPSWDAEAGTEHTGLHRFDLGSLDHTGSGQVEGSLLNDFAMSDHDGYLRVAVTSGNFMGTMPTEPMFEGDVGQPILDEPVSETTTAPEPVDPATATSTTQRPPSTETTIPGDTVSEPAVTEPAIEEPIEEPMPVDPFPMPTVVEPPMAEVTNEIVVLDTDGDLDVVGRTPSFGHPGESLHGIRFEGDIAYAVTFLQTDPFYVIDLSDPTDPRIQGELELPGFSAYLHPISATEVVGFGPDENGRASAKLFDVADRTAPRLVDSIVLGDDSPVVWDHHAFVSLGDDRFAVPASNWDHLEPACDICPGGQYSGVENHVVVLAVSGGRLVEEERVSVELPESIVRLLPAPDGWGLLTSTQFAVVDDAGAVRGTVDLG